MAGRRGPTDKLRGIAFEEQGWHVAVCLDHYLVTQARTWEELPAAIHNLILTHVLACRELGVEPFEGFPRAPDRYWKLFETLAGRPTWAPASPEGVFAGLPRVEFRVANESFA